MKVLEALELVEVSYSDNKQKVTFVFLDEAGGDVYEVYFNRQIYRDEKWIDDEEKAKKVDEWCKEYFNLAYKDLSKAVGTKHDVYCYTKFSSLWECEMIEKFTEDDDGMIYETEVKEIIVDDFAIRIRYDIEGKTYESKMSYGKYMEGLKKWFKNPVEQERVFNKFEEKFLVPIEDRDELIGHKLIVDVKCAFGKFYYGDIRKFPKKK